MDHILMYSTGWQLVHGPFGRFWFNNNINLRINCFFFVSFLLTLLMFSFEYSFHVKRLHAVVVAVVHGQLKIEKALMTESDGDGRMYSRFYGNSVTFMHGVFYVNSYGRFKHVCILLCFMCLIFKSWCVLCFTWLPWERIKLKVKIVLHQVRKM